MTTMLPNYYGYDTDFDWDRRYFIPFIMNFCLYYKFIPLLFGVIINWLIMFRSPTYSTEYRLCLAFYHISLLIFDIHHFIFFVPYPLPPYPIFLCYGVLCQLGVPPALVLDITIATAVFTAISLCLLIFLRMRLIVPPGSRFRLTIKQSVLIMGSLCACLLVNIPMFAVFATDSTNKETFLERAEFTWMRNVPGVLIYGDIFAYGQLEIPMYCLFFCVVYGIVFFPSILAYTAVSLARFVKDSMVCYSIHLLMNKSYQRELIVMVRRIVTALRCPVGQNVPSYQANVITSVSAAR